MTRESETKKSDGRVRRGGPRVFNVSYGTCLRGDDDDDFVAGVRCVVDESLRDCHVDSDRGGGLDAFDCETAAQDGGQGCGTYQLSGDTIQFNWAAGGQSNPVAFTRSADRLRIGATNYFRVEPADVRRLTGVYARRSFTNLSGGAGVVSGETTIAFDGGGRFESTGFVGFAAGGAGATSSSGRDAGDYRIEGTTLELVHADGRRTRHTAFLMPKEDNVLVIDGTTYLKRNN